MKLKNSESYVGTYESRDFLIALYAIEDTHLCINHYKFHIEMRVPDCFALRSSHRECLPTSHSRFWPRSV